MKKHDEKTAGTRFSKVPVTFRARTYIFLKIKVYRMVV